MSKGLEAFRIMVKDNDLELPYHNTIQVIEKELKEKETQDNYIKMLEDRIDNLETTYLRNKKALEIIKAYPYELTTALAQPSYEMYCLWFKNFKSVKPKLSEAQYNLIRSVMCEDK